MAGARGVLASDSSAAAAATISVRDESLSEAAPGSSKSGIGLVEGSAASPSESWAASEAASPAGVTEVRHRQTESLRKSQ